VIGLAAGVASAVQAAVMATFGRRVGTVEALGFAMLVAGATGVAIVLFARRSFHFAPAGLHSPVWLWTGGALSAVIVLSITFATPRIGVTATVGLLIAGQFAAAALIDRFGLLGVQKAALHWPRLLGLAFLAAGAALSLRR
jgi:transporter family-2 protein